MTGHHRENVEFFAARPCVTGPGHALVGADKGEAASVAAACAELTKAGLTPSLMVDCSHANSSKQHERQVDVARDIAAQTQGGSRHIFGVMVESHLNAGAQKFTPGKGDSAKLAYGQSITDACLGWDDSVKLLDILSDAVKTRRAR